MNTDSYSLLLTEEMTANHEHNGSIAEHFHCPEYDTKTNKRKPLEKWQEPERLLQLNPFPVLDTDPSLNISKFSQTPIYLRSIKQNKIYTQSTKNKIEQTNVSQGELKGIDHLNYTKIKKHNMHKTQRRRKTIKTFASKSLNTSNHTNKSDISSSITNDHQNQNSNEKDHSGVPNKKIILNHVQISPTRIPGETKRTLKSAKHFNDISKLKETSITKNDQEINSNRMNSKRKTIRNKNDTSEKEQVKPSNKNNKKSNLRIKRRNDNTNNIPVHPISSSNIYVLNSSVEYANNSSTFSNAQSINKKTEQDILIDDSNKSIFVHVNSDVPKKKVNSEKHSGLRLSLFSNVPPYIRFSSYDRKGESFPLILKNFLKWKLNFVTPVVVRRIVENSGFKLVRSEHSVNYNTINTLVLNQFSQIGTTIQNHCGITPPIVDVFCGAVPQPNKLKMSPRSQPNDWVGTWSTYIKSICFKTLCKQQKLNHFPGTVQIGRKDRLWGNLHRLMLKYGKDQFGFIPKSYILPQETKLLQQVLEKNKEDIWIIKPPASARGSGIRVISKWHDIPKNVSLVVQRYIANPYLINETKFDLRLYILITSINPLRLYLYDNGLVRFASVKYSTDPTTISNRYMHLTNYSINRLSSQYTQNEDANACQGHKWTLRSFWTYMEKEQKIDVKQLWDRLADLVVKTVISGESPVNQMCLSNLSNSYNAYELFGIDVLFDEYLKPWILEVNISPSLHSSSKLDSAVKGPLIKDLMNMVGYHIPNEMSLSTHNTLLKTLGINSPLCFDERLYTLNLSAREQEKQKYFTNIESREKYINSILDELLPDDVRHLVIYEDELSQIGSFKKIFPTTSSYKYHQYFDNPRYYNMLFDAWENKYADKREKGISELENLCQLKFHLKVPEADEILASST